MAQRVSLSATIEPPNYAYLEGLVASGAAASVSEALDRALDTARRLDNRVRLERQTGVYFESMDAGGAAEESRIEEALSAASAETNFDQP